MQLPSSTPSPAQSASTAVAASSAPVEIIERPEPGTLARGVWEAPVWAFYASAGVVLLAALLYGARRAGLLGRRRPPG